MCYAFFGSNLDRRNYEDEYESTQSALGNYFLCEDEDIYSISHIPGAGTRWVRDLWNQELMHTSVDKMPGAHNSILLQPLPKDVWGTWGSGGST